MVAVVNGKGEQVNDFQFLDWEKAENYLMGQREWGLFHRSRFCR